MNQSRRPKLNITSDLNLVLLYYLHTLLNKNFYIISRISWSLIVYYIWLVCFLPDIGQSSLRQVARNISEENDATEHETSANPVLEGEGILKIPDWEQERQELPECENKGGGETGALWSEDKDSRNAEILEHDITKQVKNHHRDSNAKGRKGHGFTLHTYLPMMIDIRR